MRINVKVLPNAKTNRLVQEEGRCRIYLKVRSGDPRTNRALIKFLAAHYYVKSNMINILSGSDKREKLVQVLKG